MDAVLRGKVTYALYGIIDNIKSDGEKCAEYNEIIRKYYSKFLHDADPRSTREVAVTSITHTIINIIDVMFNKISEDDVERYAPSNPELYELLHNKEFKEHIKKVLPNCKMDIDIILDEAYKQYYWSIFNTTSQLVEELKSNG